MAINQGDIQFAEYVLAAAIHTNKPLPVQDCVLIKSFIEALLEQQNRPTENVKSREWRAGIYRKILQDPEALHQFTLQAIEKFGIEDLSRMVVPEIQQEIVESHVEHMPAQDLYELLKSKNRLLDLVDALADNEPDFVRRHLGNNRRADIEEDDVDDDSSPDQDDEDGWTNLRRFYR